MIPYLASVLFGLSNYLHFTLYYKEIRYIQYSEMVALPGVLSLLKSRLLPDRV